MTRDLTAYIFMKEHSERVPNKNLREINGKPLFFYIMRTLTDCKSVNQIVINTDSNKIANLIYNYYPKTIVIMRDERLLGDMVGANELIDSDLKNFDTEHILQTHSTNPLLKAKTIEDAIEKYFSVIPEYDSLFSVTAVRKRYYSNDQKPLNHDPDKIARTQDLIPIFEENSCFYIFSKRSFKQNSKNRTGKKPYLYEIDVHETLDIDEMIEFEYAKFILEKEAVHG